LFASIAKKRKRGPSPGVPLESSRRDVKRVSSTRHLLAKKGQLGLVRKVPFRPRSKLEPPDFESVFLSTGSRLPRSTVISDKQETEMKFKSLFLGSAAIVGLAALSLPATAFTHHPATPEEQRQTDDLNAQQLAQAQSGTNQTAQTSATASGVSSNATAMNAPSQEGGMASAVASGTVSLDAVANPPQTLANASVETANGQAVGAVQKVVTGTDGKARALDVALLGPQSKIVAIEASQLSYDQSRNVVVARLSADQIQALPAAPQG
jgi:hypothetical protein